MELTGTPSPNGLMDLWSQIYLLDGGARLGKYYTHFRNRYFDPGRRGRDVIYQYDPKEGAADAVLSKISDICISMKASDYLQLPDCIVHDIPVELDTKAKKAYNELERKMVLSLPDGDIDVASAAALSNKLQQLANGALHGQHALVFYNFKHDKDRILTALAKSGLRVREFTGAKEEVDWNAGKIDILLAHPASTAYGLNLQNGGHHIIWFGLNWSLELYQQANKRLHRQGQKEPVIIHQLICTGTRDEDLVDALTDKNTSQEKVLESLKARIKRVRQTMGH